MSENHLRFDKPSVVPYWSRYWRERAVQSSKSPVDHIHPRGFNSYTLLLDHGGLAANERNKLIRQFTVNRFTTVGYSGTYFYPPSFLPSFAATTAFSSSFSFSIASSSAYTTDILPLFSSSLERGETGYRDCASLNYDSRRLTDLFLKDGRPSLRSGNGTPEYPQPRG